MKGALQGVPVHLPTVFHIDALIIDVNHRRSFFGVIGLFGPEILAVVMARHCERDRRLRVEVNRVIEAHIADSSEGPSSDNGYMIQLKTKLELETALYMEYRYVRSMITETGLWSSRSRHRDSYFDAIHLIGESVFDVVLDFHTQRNGVRERNSARIDNMIERIQHVAD